MLRESSAPMGSRWMGHGGSHKDSSVLVSFSGEINEIEECSTNFGVLGHFTAWSQ